jgi:hypothetical protein
MRTRAYRRHQRARIRARHLREYRELIPDARHLQPPKDIAVRHPLDCGRRCFLCHHDKLLRRPRRREREEWRGDARFE